MQPFLFFFSLHWQIMKLVKALIFMQFEDIVEKKTFTILKLV